MSHLINKVSFAPHPCQVEIHSLLPQEQYYLPQETGNYSVAGFRIVIDRKVSHYIITYYIPSGLFVVVSWASFLIPCDDIQVYGHSTQPGVQALSPN